MDRPNRALAHLILISKRTHIFVLTTEATPGKAFLMASLKVPFQDLGRKQTPVNWNEPDSDLHQRRKTARLQPGGNAGDRLKPESAPVIQAIARGLETNPNLKLQIEGHTNSVGNAAHNLDLSKRRAEAVKTVLASQFKVDASRLTTAGLGASKPIDSNDTPQGRSQNRRVEFVRQ